MTEAPPAPTTEQLVKATETAISLGRSMNRQPLQSGRSFPLDSDDVTFRLNAKGSRHAFEFYDDPVRKGRFKGVTIVLSTRDGTHVGTATIDENGEAVMEVDLPERTPLFLAFALPAA